MGAVTQLITEQVRRREYNRKFLHDNARRMHGLPAMDPDPPPIIIEGKKEPKKETPRPVQPQPQVVQPPLQPQVSKPVEEKEDNALGKYLPYVLAATLGAGAIGVPWAVSNMNGDETPPGNGDTVIVDEEGERSLFQTIEDEGKHLIEGR